MFSLHVDTARTWRGGQNQVLLTVNGLREIGHRTALVAHPDGELLARAAEGLDRLAAIHRNAAMLLHLVEGFLRLADADAGSHGSGTTALASDALRTEMARWAEYFIAARPVELTIRIGADLPAVLVDEAKLRIIAMNLLSNAAKFTQTGSIAISADSEDALVRVAVRDTGIGIARDHLERIFEPFYQAGHGDSGYSEGTGVGLTIARKLARQMGGDITVESEPGTGATFFLTLPRARPAAHGGAGTDESPPHAAVGA